MGKEKSRSLYWEKLPKKNPLIKGRNYLLLIGIDAYQNITPLQNATKDVKDFLHLLCEKYQFEEKDAVVLLNEEATRENIIDAFDRLVEIVKENDNLIIYYAGHGTLDRRKRGYWIPVEAQSDRRAQLIYHTVIREYIADIASRHTLMIVDSCFSGSMMRDAQSDEEIFSNRVEGLPSRWLLTSGRNEVVSDGRAGKNSPFAHCMLTFLRENANHKLSVSSLVQHVKISTPRTAQQTPYGSYMHGVGDQRGEMIFHLREVDTEKSDWEKAKVRHSLSAYIQFRKKYPRGTYYREALIQIQLLEEDELWKKVKRRNRISAYLEYLDEYPEGRYADQAHQAIETLQAPKPDPQALAWQKAEGTDTYKAYQHFLDQYDTGDLADKARHRMVYIEELAWQETTKKDTEDAYRAFYRMYPKSTYYQSAVDKVNEKKEARMWEGTKKKDDVKDYKSYLKLFPYGMYASEAKRRVEALSKPKFPVPEMVFVKGDTFMMGDEKGLLKNALPIHRVTLDDFHIGKFPITVAQYRAYCESEKVEMPKEPSWKWQDKYPMVRVSWDDAQAYCKWLSEQTGKRFRLSTEAEWEYAARGGQKTQKFLYAGGNELDKVGWYRGNSNGTPHGVGQKKGNELGLYDMSGNVWEWCEDVYERDFHQHSPKSNPLNKKSDGPRVLRGGGWNDINENCRVPNRGYYDSDLRSNFVGFRVVQDST